MAHILKGSHSMCAVMCDNNYMSPTHLEYDVRTAVNFTSFHFMHFLKS